MNPKLLNLASLSKLFYSIVIILIYINDLPLSINANIGLYADYTILYIQFLIVKHFRMMMGSLNLRNLANNTKLLSPTSVPRLVPSQKTLLLITPMQPVALKSQLNKLQKQSYAAAVQSSNSTTNPKTGKNHSSINQAPPAS